MLGVCAPLVVLFDAFLLITSASFLSAFVTWLVAVVLHCYSLFLQSFTLGTKCSFVLYLTSTLCTLLWTSSRGLVALQEELGKGLACILPARQGSQIGSGAVFKSIAIPVTRFRFKRAFTSARWWWTNLLCHKSKSRGMVVAADANLDFGHRVLNPSNEGGRRCVLFLPNRSHPKHWSELQGTVGGG